MMSSDYIIDVNEVDFEAQVVEYSNQTAVVVDFWAEWCQPCKLLAPILEKIARQEKGAFRLAKVNVDQNPNLAVRLGIHSIPLVKSFRNGQIAAEFLGLQPESKIREFIRKLVPSQSDLILEKARSYFTAQEWSNAKDVYAEILIEEPENPVALLGFAKCQLFLNEYELAVKSLQDFPTSRQFQAAELLLPLAKELLNPPEMTQSEDELDLAYGRSLHLIRRGNIPAALDGLLGILKQNKNYRSGLAHKLVLALFELLGEEEPATIQYRQELATILF